MTEAMYEDLLKRKQLQIDEYWQLINEQDKHIQELQEENERLKTDYEVLSCSVGAFGELQEKLEEEQRKNNGLEELLAEQYPDLKQSLDWANEREAELVKQNKELQEENAKLKKRNGELAGQKASLTRWFGEAKSIIRELMNTQPPLENVYDIGKFDIDDYGDAIAKAEAFLKG